MSDDQRGRGYHRAEAGTVAGRLVGGTVLLVPIALYLLN